MSTPAAPQADEYDEFERVPKALLEKVKALTPAQRKRLLELATPRMVEKYMAHIPHAKQQVFLGIASREAMYGGAAGGGKSDALLMAALQYVDVPGYSALLLRRTWPDLNSPGAILDRARTWLAGSDVHIKDGGRVMQFPSGARIQFGYIALDKDKYKFQSAEYQFVGFDELTQFQEAQYTYLFSRIRRPQLACLTCGGAVRKYLSGWHHTNSSQVCDDLFPDPKVLMQYPAAPDGMTVFDVPLRMRSATNPGGTGHEWVRSRFVDPKTRTKDAFFVPARLTDNPSLDQQSYRENLEHLTIADRERLLRGDWDVAEEGKMFQRQWFRGVNEAPASRRKCRYWDRAATENGGDFTVGALVSLSDDGRWCIEDIVRGQWSSLQVERIVKQTADQDGRLIPIRFEQEPGSSGKDVIDHYQRSVLVGYNFDGIRSTGSKSERAAPLESAAEAGNVSMVIAQWNKAFLDEASMFPLGAHDDQIDAVSGALNFIAGVRRSRVLV